METVMEGKPKNVAVIELPESLRTRELAQAWADYTEHRRGKRSKITELAAKLIFKKFEKWGPALSVIAIHNSILNGWTGLFEPKPEKAKAAQVNGAARVVPRSPEVQVLMVREMNIVKLFNDMEPTEQDVLLAEFRRLSPKNEFASHVHRAFREWAYDTKSREAQ